MEILHLIKKISFFAAVPILLMLAIAGILKLLVPSLQKLSDKSFQTIDLQSAKPRPISRYGKFAFVSFKIMIGYIIFIVFLQMFSLPLYFVPALKWEPPLIIVIILFAIATLFSGLITYKLMQVVNKTLNPLGDQQYND
jgi:hypothetical protein